MCGIAGFCERNHVSTVTTIKNMIDSQAHRGPDAEGFCYEDIGDISVALGHRRLSIIDVSESANQPMYFENLSIVYNGEVYNFAEIRKELESYHYVFQTNSDTETVLKAFHKWGVAAIYKFRGMFAFCILDKFTNKMFLVRDRTGVKPLYYYHDGNTLLFSSEVRSFRFHSNFKKGICNTGLKLYLQYGYIPSPWTIYQNAKKVRAGHYIEYDLNKNTINETSYWSLLPYYLEPKIKADESEITEQLESILSESFSLRLISDVPVGLLLSGGIDSSLIAALLQTRRSGSIDTFTIGFENANFDESRYAKNVAGYLGTKHHEKMCTLREAESIIPLIPKIYDEPFADASAIPITLISDFVKKQVAVILSGDGGDEMFCGYTSYYINQSRINLLNKIPFNKQFKKCLDYLPDPMINLYRFHYDYYNRYLKMKSILEDNTIEEKYHSITQTFTKYDLNVLLKENSDFTPKVDNPNLSTLEKMMLVDFNQYLPDNLMVKVDRATMYYSVEGREPLLDHKILEFAAQLPLEIKLKKHILKKILKKYLPTQYYDRKKQGFGVPINHWLRHELNYLMEKYLSIKALNKQGLFNSEYVAGLCGAFMRNKTENPRIWTLIAFQMWYEEYFDQIF